jgi:hypothetical protein
MASTVDRTNALAAMQHLEEPGETVKARESVYWLASVAAHQQREAPEIDTPENANRIQRATVTHSSARGLSHLAALLTRGNNISDTLEQTRVVAVTIGEFPENSLKLSIFARFSLSLIFLFFLDLLPAKPHLKSPRVAQYQPVFIGCQCAGKRISRRCAGELYERGAHLVGTQLRPRG